jgi:hypothetical protein
LNLAPDERDLAAPGTDLPTFETRFGRLGVLIGRDTLYPELARLLAIQGADLLVGINACPGVAQGSVIRSALALRAEENQVFTAASFLLGSNYLGQENREDLYGQSALLGPISLTHRGDGILIQTGTDRTEGLVAAELDMAQLYNLRQNSRFRPRQEMNLGTLGPVLADIYQQGLTIEQAIDQGMIRAPEPVPEPSSFESVPQVEAAPVSPEPGSEAVVPPPPETLASTADDQTRE